MAFAFEAVALVARFLFDLAGAVDWKGGGDSDVLGGGSSCTDLRGDREREDRDLAGEVEMEEELFQSED